MTASTLGQAGWGTRTPDVVLVVVCVAGAWWMAFGPGQLPSVFPYDEVLFVANGVFFHTLLSDLPAVASDPVGWMQDYYAQYPALAVRRHPPLYGLVQGLAFLFTGPSLTGARLVHLGFVALFLWAAGTLVRTASGSRALALVTVLVLVSFPPVRAAMNTIWLDLPALALAILAVRAYLAYLERARFAALTTTAALLVAALYTYQLAGFFAAAIAIHFCSSRWRELRTGPVLGLALVSAVALAPLTIFQFMFAGDNVASALGNTPAKWAVFQSTHDSVWAQVFVYVDVLWGYYPLALVLLGVRLAVAAVKRSMGPAEGICLISALLAYAFFTWVQAGAPRYALYIVTPLCVGAMIGLAGPWAQLMARSRAGGIAALAGLAVLAIVQLVHLPTPWSRLLGLEEAMASTLGERQAPRIVYAGPREAAYVLALRLRDPRREARIVRAATQIGHPDEVGTFLQTFDANVIVFEFGDAHTEKAAWPAWQQALERVASNGEWTRHESPMVLLSPDRSQEFTLVTLLREPDG